VKQGEIMIEIVIRSDDRGHSFKAFVNGEQVGNATNQPFFATARKLLDEGTDPETEITMRHEKSQIVSKRATVGEAAKLIVIEKEKVGPIFGKWKPSPFAAR
jgi:hypothetical protein